jgi:hypothetical protein
MTYRSYFLVPLFPFSLIPTNLTYGSHLDT